MNDLLDPSKDMPEQPGDPSQALKRLLEARGVDVTSAAELERFKPVPIAEYQPPDCAQFAAFRIKADGYDSVIPCACLGVAGIGDWNRAEAEQIAKQMAIKLHGAPAGCLAHLTMVTNQAWINSEHARRIMPEILDQFPKGHAEWDSLTETAWNSKAIAAAKSYVKRFDKMLATGRGLRLRNDITGCGKTALLSTVAIQAARQYAITAYYAYMPTLHRMDLRDENRRKVIETCKSVHLLLLDDVDAGCRANPDTSEGADEDASLSRSTMLDIVNHRYNQQMPVLWTSNAGTAARMVNALGERLLRKLSHNQTKLEFKPGAWDWFEKRGNEYD